MNHFVLPQQLIGVLNHLWQSTLFAGAMAMLVLTLRNHRARFRHTLWTAASLKFLIPFGALVALGSHLPKPRAQALPLPPAALVAVSKPFHLSDSPPVFALPQGHPLPPPAPIENRVADAIELMWLIGLLAVATYGAMRWRRLATCARNAQRVSGLPGVPRNIPILISNEAVEPGALGIVRPSLLLPATILDSLSPAQLDAVIAHELSHIRRLDNLWSLLHMAVEAVFWFHPLVWWLGARMLEDRERACDETVLGGGCDPEIYAATLLRVCRQHMGMTSALVAGAGGSDLNRRVAGIMTQGLNRNLNRGQKAMFAVLGIAAIAAPIMAGLAYPRTSRAQTQEASSPPKFDVVSVKPNDTKDPRIGAFPSPGRLVIHNFTLKRLILMTYNLKDFQLDGAKGWMDNDAWDIEGTFPAIPGKSNMQAGADRLPALLKERFHIVVHRETRQLPVYTLVVAKGGPKLTASDPNDGKSGNLRVLPPRADPGGFTYIKMDFRQFAGLLGGELNLPVIDKTGIAGTYDVTLSYTSHRLLDSADYTGNGVSVFTAIQQQLGLKLEETKGPVEVLVVDRAEKPAPN